MRYLIIEINQNTHYLKDELLQSDLDNSRFGYLSIFDLELKLFHVKDNTWQKIQEK